MGTAEQVLLYISCLLFGYFYFVFLSIIITLFIDVSPSEEFTNSIRLSGDVHSNSPESAFKLSFLCIYYTKIAYFCLVSNVLVRHKICNLNLNFRNILKIWTRKMTIESNDLFNKCNLNLFDVKNIINQYSFKNKYLGINL